MYTKIIVVLSLRTPELRSTGNRELIFIAILQFCNFADIKCFLCVAIHDAFNKRVHIWRWFYFCTAHCRGCGVRQTRQSRRYQTLPSVPCWPLANEFEYTLRCEIRAASWWVTSSYTVLASPSLYAKRPIVDKYNRKYVAYRNAARPGTSHGYR